MSGFPRGRLSVRLLCWTALVCVNVAAQGEPLLDTSVGMRGRIEELPLPGTRLRAVEVDDPQLAEMIVRIVDVFPHGSDFRYTFEVMPLVAGRLDLRKHLEREDGAGVEDLPELPILVRSLLPPGRIQPNELDVEDPDRVGGYRTWQIVAGVFWLTGLLAILFVGRRRRSALSAAGTRRLSLAERLRPLVERAQAGSLDHAGRAELERLILAHWRRRRNLEEVKASEAIAALRRDPEAGALLLKLEEWLHSPAADEVDVASLLQPYGGVPDTGDAEEPA